METRDDLSADIAVRKISDPDFRLLLYLAENDGWTAGQIAQQMDCENPRRAGARIRLDLLRMEKLGWVERLDDRSPTAWVRTPAGTEAMNV